MAWVAVAIAGSAVIGAGVTAYSNSQAADKASDAAIQGANIQAASNEKARAENERLTREGLGESQGRFDKIVEGSEPARNYLRRVIAEPGSLTPEQAQQLTDLRRSTGNQIRTSSIAGSGRTASSLLRRVESDFTNDALQKNKLRADNAANTMFGPGTQAEYGAAGMYVNALGSVGKTGADLISKSGQAQGNAVAQGGLYQANADTANAKVAGEAIGDVGWAMASGAKQSKFGSSGSSYSPYDAGWSGGEGVGASAY